MDMELIVQIFEVCIIPLLGILTTYFVKLINAKIGEINGSQDNELQKKYLILLNETIKNCVIATTQTYVESLKKQGKFDAEAQKEAFNLTLNAVLNILNDDAKKVLTEAVGDLNLYISQMIEAEVKLTKNN